MIRIVHILPELDRGGGQQVAMTLLRGMDRSRFEPVLVSLFGRGTSVIEALLEKENIRVVYLGKRLGPDLRMPSRIYRVLRDLDADVVHTHLNCLRYALPAIVALKKRLVAVHTIHNLAQFEVCRFDRALYRIGFRYFNVMPVAIANAVQESCIQVYGLKGALIPNGIVFPSCNVAEARSRIRAQHHIREDEVVLVSVGRLTPQKNHHLLLEALALAIQTHDRIRCLIVGDGERAAELKAKVEILSLQRVVQFFGHRADVPQILAAADVGVLSSAWEGNPLCVMEMMVSGIPVIGTAVGGVPELITDSSGIVVPPGDARAFSDAIVKMAIDVEGRKRMGTEAARVAQQRFGTDKMTRRYEELYASRVAMLHRPTVHFPAVGD